MRFRRNFRSVLVRGCLECEAVFARPTKHRSFNAPDCVTRAYSQRFFSRAIERSIIGLGDTFLAMNSAFTMESHRKVQRHLGGLFVFRTDRREKRVSRSPVRSDSISGGGSVSSLGEKIARPVRLVATPHRLSFAPARFAALVLDRGKPVRAQLR